MSSHAPIDNNGHAPSKLEIWGGLECTVNRVGDRYYDQIEASGHASRPTDIDLLADLGISALRYPVLWERTEPHREQAEIDWSWSDQRLHALRARGVRPIVGLVHHGSGPPATDLLCPSFATGLAEFARAVARRYPWLDLYTPVNEPLTTARFSTLYGHWYPHKQDPYVFAQACLVQCRAIALSMGAIREVNPGARLVQTEDVGRTHSMPRLAYQADFENERRWVTWDLLCGKFESGHPMYEYFKWLGIPDRDLDWFRENPCPPDILGVNYYVTSERFLDDRLDLYPPSSHGGNGRDRYADVEAVRARPEGLTGPASIIAEVWDRYHRPIANTEVHLGCSREQQMRWLVEVWRAARQQRAQGVDVRAIAIWSMLGAFDWNSLLTRWEGHYEPGVFDLRSPQPRPTASAGIVRQLADGREPDHPALDGSGWWQLPQRLLRPDSSAPSGSTPKRSRIHAGSTHRRPLLILGAGGKLGGAFARICERRGLHALAYRRGGLDIAESRLVEEVLDWHKPWAVVNAAGYRCVDRAEVEPDVCRRENATGPHVLARACASRRTSLLTFSSHLVFDGQLRRPYRETDTAAPLNVYGRSKLEAESHVVKIHEGALVIRSSAFFGPWDAHNFIATVLRSLSEGDLFRAADDTVISPTYLPELVEVSLDLLIDGATGIWHLANTGAVTWAGLARQAAGLARMDSDRIEPLPMRDMGLLAQRPLYSALESGRGDLMPPWEESLVRYFHDCKEFRLTAAR